MKAVEHTPGNKQADQSVTDSSGITRVSIAEARRIMGDASRSMSDDDIQKAIYDLTAIARAYIKSVPK